MENLKVYFNAINPLSEEAWDAVFPLFRLQSLAADDFFVKEQSIAREIGFLKKGCVRAFFTNSSGKEYNKQFFVGPSLIGAYSSLLTGEPNLIPQQALTDCQVWVANYKELAEKFSDFHDFERLARKIAEYYFLEKEKKELEMALQDATQRYLNFREQFPNLEQEIAQYHIASYLGVSATQLSRVRNKLSKEG